MEYLKKIFSPILLLISLLLFIYTFYKSEFYWDGFKRDYYLIYYILSSLLVFLSFISFFISSKIKEYLIILGISLVTSLYAFEGYLTFKYSHYQKIKERKKIYEKRTGNKFDIRPKLEVFEDLKKIEKNVSVKVSPQNFLKNNLKIFPFSSVSNSKTVYGNENGYYFIYKSDRYGFNNPDDEWNSREIEYLLTGDSFVHGANVNRPNDLSSVLRTLSNKSVLNLGYRGNGPLIEYATLREYLNSKVKKVLWVYSANDIRNLSDEKNEKFLLNYLNDKNFIQNLRLKQNEIDNKLKNHLEKRIERLKNIDKKSVLKEFLKIYNLRTLIFKKKETSEISLSEFKEILLLAQDLTKKNNSELYFIYLPGYARYVGKDDTIKTYISVKDIVEEVGIPFIDIHKHVFEKKKNQLEFFPFEQLGHYNVEGYKEVAETIYKFTKN